MSGIRVTVMIRPVNALASIARTISRSENASAWRKLMSTISRAESALITPMSEPIDRSMPPEMTITA